MTAKEWRMGAVVLGMIMLSVGWGDYRDGLIIGGSILIASVVISAALRGPEPPK
jgi:hypothetical protein